MKSVHFTLQELLFSATAKARRIENIPTFEVVASLGKLVETVLDPLREEYGSPIRVVSGYRSEELNRAVGGAVRSQHKLGQAADLVPVDGDVERLFQCAQAMIRDGRLVVGQLILESGRKSRWIHISMPGRHLNQILRIAKQ